MFEVHRIPTVLHTRLNRSKQNALPVLYHPKNVLSKDFLNPLQIFLNRYISTQIILVERFKCVTPQK